MEQLSTRHKNTCRQALEDHAAAKSALRLSTEGTETATATEYLEQLLERHRPGEVRDRARVQALHGRQANRAGRGVPDEKPDRTPRTRRLQRKPRISGVAGLVGTRQPGSRCISMLCFRQSGTSWRVVQVFNGGRKATRVKVPKGGKGKGSQPRESAEPAIKSSGFTREG